MKNLIICFSGIDGSGKSTLCNNVLNHLKSRKIPTRYVYGRFLPALMAPVFMMISALVLHKRNPNENSDVHRKSKRTLLSNPVFSKLFITGIFIDQTLRVFLKICLPSLFKRDIIVCDRYLFDTVITDIALTCGLSEAEVTRLLQRWLRLFPKARVVFIVHVPPEVAYDRKKDLHSLGVLKELSQNYLYAGKHLGATILDGTKAPSQLKCMVLDKLTSIGVRDLE